MRIVGASYSRHDDLRCADRVKAIRLQGKSKSDYWSGDHPGGEIEVNAAIQFELIIEHELAAGFHP